MLHLPPANCAPAGGAPALSAAPWRAPQPQRGRRHAGSSSGGARLATTTARVAAPRQLDDAALSVADEALAAAAALRRQQAASPAQQPGQPRMRRVRSLQPLQPAPQQAQAELLHHAGALPPLAPQQREWQQPRQLQREWQQPRQQQREWQPLQLPQQQQRPQQQQQQQQWQQPRQAPHQQQREWQPRQKQQRDRQRPWQQQQQQASQPGPGRWRQQQQAPPRAPLPPPPPQQQQAAQPRAPNMQYTRGIDQDWSVPTGLAITWLGSSSGAPTRDRNVSCTVLRTPRAAYLVDCGEGSSRQAKLTGMRLEQIDAIFITHLHGDHCFGIGTMLVAICRARAAAAAAAAAAAGADAGAVPGAGAAAADPSEGPGALRLVGPPRLSALVSAMLLGAGVARQLTLPLYVTELVDQPSDAHDWRPLLPAGSPGRAFVRRLAPTQLLGPQDWAPGLVGRLDATGLPWQTERNQRPGCFIAKPGLAWRLPCSDVLVTAAQLQHRVPCIGFVFDELHPPPPQEKQPQQKQQQQRQHGRKPGGKGPAAAQQQQQQQPAQEPPQQQEGGAAAAAGASRPRRVLLLGDTVDSRAIAPLAVGADLVAHEATYAAGMEAKAIAAQHSTAWMAGQFAWALQARALVLTHFSARYEGSAADVPGHGRGTVVGGGARDALVAGAGADERAIMALQREAEEHFGLGPVLLARDLLTVHVPPADAAA